MIFLTENLALIGLAIGIALVFTVAIYLRAVFKLTDRQEVFNYFDMFAWASLIGILAGRISFVSFNWNTFRDIAYSYTPFLLNNGLSYVKVMPYALLEFWNGYDLIVFILTFLLVGIHVGLGKYKFPKIRVLGLLLGALLLYIVLFASGYAYIVTEPPILVLILLGVILVVYLTGFLLKFLESSKQTIINYRLISLVAMLSILIVIDSIVVGGFKGFIWFSIVVGLAVSIGIKVFVGGKSAPKQPKIEVVMKDWK